MPDPSLSDSRILEPSNNAYESAILIDEEISNEERDLLAEDGPWQDQASRLLAVTDPGSLA